MPKTVKKSKKYKKKKTKKISRKIKILRNFERV